MAGSIIFSHFWPRRLACLCAPCVAWPLLLPSFSLSSSFSLLLFLSVLDEKYVDYKTACEFMKVESLETRRTNLCLKFALKCLKSEKFKDFFEVNSSKDCYQFRDTETFYIPFASTTRYQKSSKIYLTSLLNKHFKTNDH